MATSIDTLTTRFEADVSKFEASMKKMVAAADQSLGAVEARHKASHDKIESIWGSLNLGEAFGNIGNSLKSGALEEGAANIGVLGSALEALGPAGIAAGAALAGLGIGLEQAKKAMEWAEELEIAANKLGVTTTALQELDFAAIASGVSQDTFREGLQKVSQAIGAYQSNIKDARVNSIFQALGISKDDARAWQDPIDGLEEIADKISQVKDRSEQLSLLKQLKVPDDMVPLILKGRDAIADMRAEALNLGAVMDASTVKQAAELGKKLKEANQVVSIQLKTAFVALAPAVVAIANLMANMATHAADFAESILHGAAGLQGTDYSQYNTNHLQRAATQAHQDMGQWGRSVQQHGGQIGADGSITQSSSSVVADKNYNDARNQYAAIIKAWGQKIYASSKETAPKPPAVALAPEKVKAGPRDDTGSLDAMSKEAVDSADKALAQATAALATSIEAKAKAQSDSVDADTAKQLEKLNQDEAKIKSAEVNTDQQAQLDNIEAAKASVALTGLLKNQLIERQKQIDLLKQQSDSQQQDAQIRETALQVQAQRFTALAGLAVTTADRNAYELLALQTTQKMDADIAANKVQLAQALLAEAQASNDQVAITKAQKNLDSAKTAQSNLAGTQDLQNQAFAKGHANPGQQYLAQLNNTTDDFTNVQVTGLKGLTDGITGAIMQTKTLGQAFHDVAASIISDLVRIGVQRMITQPLANAIFGGSGSAGGGGVGGIGSILSMIPHFAAGTDSAPGGLSLVGEDGAELVNLSKGSQVVPHGMLKNAMGIAPGSAPKAGEVHFHNNVYADDAVLSGQIQQWIMQGSAAAVQMSRQVISGDLSRNSQTQLLRR